MVLCSITGVYYTNTYTSAILENPVFLRITNPHALISLISVEAILIEQGESQTALILTNNMGTYIAYRLEYSSEDLQLSPEKGTLAPGGRVEIAVTATDSRPPGSTFMKVKLHVDFDGGRASLNTTVHLQVEALPEEEIIQEPELDDEPEPVGYEVGPDSNGEAPGAQDSPGNGSLEPEPPETNHGDNNSSENEKARGSDKNAAEPGQ